MLKKIKKIIAQYKTMSKTHTNKTKKFSLNEDKTQQNHNDLCPRYECEFTENSSKAGSNSKSTLNSFNKFNKFSKKSIEFFPSKINIDEGPILSKRKYTLEPQHFIRDFVPKIKPLEVNLVPSKLRLNHKGFRDLKINSNRILIQTNNLFRSCPNSSESECEVEEGNREIFDDNSFQEVNENILIFKFPPKSPHRSLKMTRKYLNKMKDQKEKIPKVLSKSNCRVEKYDSQVRFDSSGDEIGLFEEVYSDSEGDEKLGLRYKEKVGVEKKREIEEVIDDGNIELTKNNDNNRNFSSENYSIEEDNNNFQVKSIDNICNDEEEIKTNDLTKFRSTIQYNKNSQLKDEHQLDKITEENYELSNDLSGKKYYSNSSLKQKKFSDCCISNKNYLAKTMQFNGSNKDVKNRRARGLSFSILDILRKGVKFNEDK